MSGLKHESFPYISSVYLHHSCFIVLLHVHIVNQEPISPSYKNYFFQAMYSRIEGKLYLQNMNECTVKSPTDNMY